eukprot:4561927-Prymnesium_polylepis.1
MQFPTPEPPLDPFETVFVGIIRDRMFLCASRLFLFLRSPGGADCRHAHPGMNHNGAGKGLMRL